MTMKRDAKEAMLKRNVAILIGDERILSPSPQRAREFGRYAPAEWAAAFEMKRARGVRGFAGREAHVVQKLRTRRAAGMVAKIF